MLITICTFETFCSHTKQEYIREVAVGFTEKTLHPWMYRLEVADIRISMETTVDTSIPDQSFGVRALATDLKGIPLDAMDLTIVLKRLSTEVEEDEDSRAYGLEPITGKHVDSCNTKSGKFLSGCCYFSPSGLSQSALQNCGMFNLVLRICLLYLY